ncbi:hypothetical protein AALC75_20815 [Lachnospiraceae bacterium 48-42]
MKVTNVRKKQRKGNEPGPETIQIYRDLLIKLQASQKNPDTRCK